MTEPKEYTCGEEWCYDEEFLSGNRIAWQARLDRLYLVWIPKTCTTCTGITKVDITLGYTHSGHCTMVQKAKEIGIGVT